jgi:nitrite reductase (NO-forming)
MHLQSWFDGWCTQVQVIGLSFFGILLATSSVSAETHDIAMTAIETEVVIDGAEVIHKAWRFNAQFRGPVVRVTEGDTIKFTVINPGSNVYPHAIDFHAAEIDFLKNHRAINPGETLQYTFVAKTPGVLFYHCGAPPMIQHVNRGMIGAIIVDPLSAQAWPKADREYVVVQSEFFKNLDDAPAWRDGKIDDVISTGILKCHSIVTSSGTLDAKPGERVRMYFVHAGPNPFSAFHPIGETWDKVYENGKVSNTFTAVKTYTVGGSGSASTFDAAVEPPDAHSLATQLLAGTLRGAIAVLVSLDATSVPPLAIVPPDVLANRAQ